MVKRITGIILIVTAAVWAAWDVVPFYTPARGDTISEMILYYALRLFSLPLTFGVLCGHFFFPRDGAKQHPKILIPLGLVVIACDVVAHVCNVGALQFAQSYPAIPFIIGVPVGLLLWPQSKSDKL